MSYRGKLWITIDMLDGASRVVGPLYPDEITLHGLLFKLSERDVAGVTLTRADPLNRLAQGDERDQSIRQSETDHRPPG